MSDEIKLSEELAACEARLAALPLPQPAINRDQLMYEAGWAAGADSARLAALESRSLKGGPSGRTAIWSLTSAVLAASIAVMFTLQLRPNEAPGLAANPAGSRPPLAAEVVGPRSTDLPRVEFARTMISSKSIGRFNTGLIAMRQCAIAGTWSEPTRLATAHGDAEPPAAKTARELLQELLPTDSIRPTRIWFWEHTPSGDSI